MYSACGLCGSTDLFQTKGGALCNSCGAFTSCPHAQPDLSTPEHIAELYEHPVPGWRQMDAERAEDEAQLRDYMAAEGFGYQDRSMGG